MLSYSLKCKKNTEREYPKVAKTKIGKIMLISKWYPDNCPRLGLGFGSRLVLGLRGNQTIGLEENCLLVRVRVWVRVSFRVEGQFS